MGRAPCCEKIGLRRGRWTAEEDEILSNYIRVHGKGSWRSLPKNAGLLRCGKSCRLRWINYLRSDVKRGNISAEEEDTILKLHASLGNRWSLIAAQLDGRTDNEIKNYWNSHLSHKSTSSSPTTPTKRRTATTKIKKPRKRTSTEKQTNMNPDGEVTHNSSLSSGEKEDRLDDFIQDESLLMDHPNVTDHDKEDVIKNVNFSSSSRNERSQVNEVDWGWEWDFESDGGMVGLCGEEEDDDIMSWPWEGSIEELGVDVDVEKKQDAMIAWLLS